MTAALAQSDAEPVRSAWVEPDENNEGKYVLCIETPAQVETFEMRALHFAAALARAVNEHVKLYTAPPRPDASAGLIEAAKELERQACRESHFHRAEAFNEAARIVRARAADRSGT